MPQRTRRRSHLYIYIFGTVVTVIMWGIAVVPTVFYVLPETLSNYTYRQASPNQSSIWNQCNHRSSDYSMNQTLCGNVSEETFVGVCFFATNLEASGMVDERIALTARLQNCTDFDYITVERFASQYNLSTDLWQRPCYYPLKSIPQTYRCDPLCLVPQLSNSATSFRVAYGVIAIIIFVFCSTIMFTTWMSLPFMSCFPHVIPLYIVGGYGVIVIVFSLPSILSIETAFCENDTSTSETPYCFIQGIILVYGILFSSLWYFCYCFNIYVVVVHNKPHLILSNQRAYLMQSVLCWLLPILPIAIILSDSYHGKYFDWIGADYFLCILADIPKTYYLLILPLQLSVGIGSNLLFLTALFLFKSDQDSRGLKLMQDESKNSGITSLGKRLSTLCLLSSAVGIYLPCSMSYLWTFSDRKTAALLSYFECKQVTDDCPQDFLQYSVTSTMIPLRIVLLLYFLISSLFLLGTPAQIKLWKHWIARLLLCCHVPDPDGKYAAWKDDADLQQYRRSQASIRRLRVLQQAETWKNKNARTEIELTSRDGAGASQEEFAKDEDSIKNG